MYIKASISEVKERDHEYQVGFEFSRNAKGDKNLVWIPKGESTVAEAFAKAKTGSTIEIESTASGSLVMSVRIDGKVAYAGGPSASLNRAWNF